MSIITEVKREYKKLSNEMHSGQRRMKVLECMMREYKVWNYPYSEAISDIALDFVQEHSGEAAFDEIADMLAQRNIDIPHQKLSLILNRHPRMSYSREKQKWEMRTEANAA